jgi:hypothetical protein
MVIFYFYIGGFGHRLYRREGKHPQRGCYVFRSYKAILLISQCRVYFFRKPKRLPAVKGQDQSRYCNAKRPDTQTLIRCTGPPRSAQILAASVSLMAKIKMPSQSLQGGLFPLSDPSLPPKLDEATKM